MISKSVVAESSNIHVYTGGFVCKDLSSMNTSSTKSGASAATLNGSLAYIERSRPKLVILENVAREATSVDVQRILRQLGYSTVAVVTNSFHFGLPSET